MNAKQRQLRLGDYLEHMRDASRTARGYLDGIDKSEFLETRMIQQAVHSESNRDRRGGGSNRSGVSRIRSGHAGRALEETARHAQSNDTRLLRYEPRNRMGNSENRFA